MSNKVKFELNLPGLNELMKSGEMQSCLSEAAKRVEAGVSGMAQDPDATYTSDVVVANWVAIGRVHAGNGAAMRENYTNNTLVKALGSAGLGM